MKNVCFFDLPFVRHDKHAEPETNYRRILAGDKVFWMYAKQFEDISVAEKLTEGERVYIGAHPLADGTFWLHWLVAPDHGTLQPVTKGTDKARNALKTLIGTLLMGAFGYVFFNLLFGIIIFLLMLIAFIIGAWFFCSGVQGLLVSSSKRTHRLQEGLRRVQAGDLSLFHTQNDLQTAIAAQQKNIQAVVKTAKPQTPDNMIHADQVILSTLQGEIRSLSVTTGFTGTGKSRRDYRDYQFLCEGVLFTFRCYYNTFSEDVNPIFYRHPDFFLTEGDPMTLILNGENGQIVGLCNERDGQAYLKYSGIMMPNRQMKRAYKAVGLICLVLPLLMLFFSFHDWWQAGVMPDKWDWLKAGDMFLDCSFLSMSIFFLIMLLTELSNGFIEKYTVTSARIEKVRQYLVSFRSSLNKAPYIQEVT
ncbi:hypothetical protein [Providencia stuartii]|uniref:hypothetical protein n=1 Tax=Providencia stuartii TaxID=588 RepID=UPI003D059168